MKNIIKLTEADLHRMIREAVKVINEDYPFSPDEDKFDKIERLKRKEQDIEDYWDNKNRAIRKKYPGKSDEWYEAMIDSFNENKKVSKMHTFNEAVIRRAVKESLDRFVFEATAGGAGGGTVGVFSGGKAGSGAGIAGGASTTQNTTIGNGDTTVMGSGFKTKKKGSDVISKPIYNVKGGDVTKQQSNVDMMPAMKTKDGKGGSTSIPKHRVGENKELKKKELDEGWFKNAALAGTMGAASMFGGQANMQAANPSHHQTVTTTNYGSNQVKNDTVSWDDVRQITPELKQRINVFKNNGRIVGQSKYREDIIDMLKTAKPNSVAPNSLYFTSYEKVDDSSDEALVNSIQAAGLGGLKANYAYYALIKARGNTYIVGMNPNNLTALDSMGLQH